MKLADEDKPILEGEPTAAERRGARHHGPERLGQVDTGQRAGPARDGYQVTEGEILWNGESILDMQPDERAAKGVFLAFQYPMEIPGVATIPSCARPGSRRA